MHRRKFLTGVCATALVGVAGLKVATASPVVAGIDVGGDDDGMSLATVKRDAGGVVCVDETHRFSAPYAERLEEVLRSNTAWRPHGFVLKVNTSTS